MILAETIFLDGTPVGVVRQDTLTSQIVFSPINSQSRLPSMEWKSVDELKVAVAKAYSQKRSGLSGGSGTNESAN